MRRAIALVALLFGALQLLPGTARADFSLSVSPTLVEFTADPGGSIVQPITVTNEGSDAINIVVSVEDLLQGREDVSATSWFEVSPNNVELPPGETEDVKVRIEVPQDATGGGHYVAVVLNTATAVAAGRQGFTGGGAGVGARIESVFLVTVKSPDLTLEGGVVRLVPIARGEDTLGFRLEIQNSGNVHFYPTGTVDVVNESGEVVGQVSLPETPPVYPETSRSFELAGTISLPPDDYSAISKVGYGWEAWQAELINKDPEEWTAKEAEDNLTFNSEPRLRVVGLGMVAKEGQPLRVDVQLENIGDVEVEPVGWVAVFNKKGEQAFIANIAQGALPVPPRSVVSTSAESSTAIPKGQYTIEAALNYHGKATLEESSTTEVKQDIVPPAPPPRPSARALEFEPEEGRSNLIFAVAWGLGGLVVIVGIVLVLLRARRDRS